MSFGKLLLLQQLTIHSVWFVAPSPAPPLISFARVKQIVLESYRETRCCVVESTKNTHIGRPKLRTGQFKYHTQHKLATGPLSQSFQGWLNHKHLSIFRFVLPFVPKIGVFPTTPTAKPVIFIASLATSTKMSPNLIQTSKFRGFAVSTTSVRKTGFARWGQMKNAK